jgi:hypothetical protein
MNYLPREPKARRVALLQDNDDELVSSDEEDESKDDSQPMTGKDLITEEDGFNPEIPDSLAPTIPFLFCGPQILPAGVLIMIILAFLVKATFGVPISQQPMTAHGISNVSQSELDLLATESTIVGVEIQPWDSVMFSPSHDIRLPSMCVAHDDSRYISDCTVVDVDRNISVWFHITPGFGIPEVRQYAYEPPSMAMRGVHVREWSMRLRPWVSWTSDLGVCSAVSGAVITVVTPFWMCASCTVGSQQHHDKSRRTYLPRLRGYVGPDHRRKPSSLPHAKEWRRHVRASNVTLACSAMRWPDLLSVFLVDFLILVIHVRYHRVSTVDSRIMWALIMPVLAKITKKCVGGRLELRCRVVAVRL